MKVTKPAKLSEAAGSVWDDLLDSMEAFGGLSTADSFLLQTFCENVCLYREMVPIVALEGPFELDNRGRKRKSDSYKILRDCERAMLGIAKELGLTPHARKMLGMEDCKKKHEPSEWDQFL